MEVLLIGIPKWNITELSGYEPITTFWQDFSIADKLGINDIEETYECIKSEWKDDLNIGRNFVLSSITRYGNGMREIIKKLFSMISYGGKRMK